MSEIHLLQLLIWGTNEWKERPAMNCSNVTDPNGWTSVSPSSATKLGLSFFIYKRGRGWIKWFFLKDKRSLSGFNCHGFMGTPCKKSRTSVLTVLYFKKHLKRKPKKSLGIERTLNILNANLTFINSKFMHIPAVEWSHFTIFSHHKSLFISTVSYRVPPHL